MHWYICSRNIAILLCINCCCYHANRFSQSSWTSCFISCFHVFKLRTAIGTSSAFNTLVSLFNQKNYTFYVLNGLFGLGRYFSVLPSSPDNHAFQLSIGFQYLCTIVLMIITQFSLSPGAEYAAAAPSVACLTLGAHILPAFLDYNKAAKAIRRTSTPDCSFFCMIELRHCANH